MSDLIKDYETARVGQLQPVNAFPLVEGPTSFTGVQRAGRISLDRAVVQPMQGGMRGFDVQDGTAFPSGQWFGHQARVVPGFRKGGYSEA